MSNEQIQATEAPLLTRVKELALQKERIEIEEGVLLEKAMNSGNPNEILTARSVMRQKKGQGGGNKSYLFDPYLFRDALGYKEKPYSVSYDVLRGMATTPIVKSIITTRTEQVAAFSKPQEDLDKIGWTIVKTKRLFSGKDSDLTDEEKVEIEFLIDFLSNGGVEKDHWYGETFNSFLRKIVPDSLVMDQATFEVVNTRGLRPYKFFATDGATYRLATSYRNERPKSDQVEINGYYPGYVQIYQSVPVSEFYPWELAYVVRNQSTDIRKNGYGTSELEDMIKIVTWMLYSDQYNGNFFSQGASPKGFIKMKGNISDDKLSEFKSEWRSQIAGVNNAWKIPVMQADEVDWIDLQHSNEDMQFSAWQEYLIRISCAQYKMDPSEIGFYLSGGDTSNVTYEGKNDYKLKFSKDKGLKPLLRTLSSEINRMILRPLTGGKYEHIWTGVREEEEDDLADDVQKANSFMGLKEIRRKRNLPDEVDEDDIILNPLWLQMKMGMQNPQFQQGGGGDQEEPQNPFMPQVDEENPFMKDLSQFIDKELIQKSKQGDLR